MAASVENVVAGLVAWFEEHSRPLPWRETYDPYQVWVSEVMLQQTQVETALGHYRRFLTEFPDLQSLAAADEQHVLRFWAGLGYYRRARNLLAAARTVVEQHGGTLPSEYDDLIALSGVGRYMAGAILSIAFNKPFPIVDGNVRRVLSRLHGWRDENTKGLWESAGKLARAGEPRLVNQALMELGATVCTVRAPLCLLCPIQSSCIAFKTGAQDGIPPVKKRPETIHIHLFAIVQKRGARYLMKSAEGMWEFPMLAELPPGHLQKAGTCRHTITHHRLDVSVYAGKLDRNEGYSWKNVSEVPVSSLTRKILELAGLH